MPKLKIVLLSFLALISMAALAFQSANYQQVAAKASAAPASTFTQTVSQPGVGNTATSSSIAAPSVNLSALTVAAGPKANSQSAAPNHAVLQPSGNDEAPQVEQTYAAPKEGGIMCPKDATICRGPLQPPACYQIDKFNHLEAYDPLYRLPLCPGPIAGCGGCGHSGQLECLDVAICAQP